MTKEKCYSVIVTADELEILRDAVSVLLESESGRWKLCSRDRRNQFAEQQKRVEAVAAMATQLRHIEGEGK